MTKYLKNAQDNIEQGMRGFKDGSLNSGRNGICEAKEAGLKVPVKKLTSDISEMYKYMYFY